jgi:hypothetical protein
MAVECNRYMQREGIKGVPFRSVSADCISSHAVVWEKREKKLSSDIRIRKASAKNKYRG